VVATPAKLNLFLEVERRRADGYHDIESLFLGLAWGDLLLAEVRREGEEDALRVEGEEAPEDATNLVLIALAAARARRPVPPLALLLRKRIPPGTGLGGGSGDAAGLLALVEEIAPDPAGISGTREVAAAIGSDVPFFLGDGAVAIARGRGERLAPFPGRLFGGVRPWFVIVLPRIVSPTARAYARLSFPLTSPDGPITFPARTFANAGGWSRGLFNRLEGPLIAAEPRLAELASRLRDLVRAHPDAATGVGMTGSGSAYFLAARDRAGARRLLALLRAADGPLASFTAATGVPVRAVMAAPHSILP
jgi:4-diphosphocytidyl-2-C-methyl-D-erythritol kinase